MTTLCQMDQLLYYDLQFNDNFEQNVKDTGFIKNGRNYETLAIIGCQSSGKSTLLNKLFDTNFEVMDKKKGRAQTTQGIWVALHPSKFVVLDCEGTDSKERGEDRHKFEHCSSLFCLAIADILIINMWSQDVGRYTASNYGILKIVFEMNLKLFQQECAKKILIVLRDFDEQQNEISTIRELILLDINNIWSDIKKPEQFKDRGPKDFFLFEFFALPHKIYREKEFDSKILELRERLDSKHGDYLFNHVSEAKNVPADGLSYYCHQIWDTIITQKDLNIPSQKEMLANYRCNEIRNNILDSYQNVLNELSARSTTGVIKDFKETCGSIVDKILAAYDEQANNYIDKIYKEVKGQLYSHLSQSFYLIFTNQINRYIPTLQKNFKKDLESELTKQDNFILIATQRKKKYLGILHSHLESLKVFDTWIINVSMYEEIFDELIDNIRKQSLERIKAENIKKLKKQIEESLVARLEDPQSDFWHVFNSDYFQHMFIVLFALQAFLKDFYDMNDEEAYSYIIELEDEAYNVTKKEFLKKTKEIAEFAVDLFKKKFNYDERKGLPRQWDRMEESSIEETYEKYRKECLNIFELFKCFNLLKNPLKFLNYTKTSEDNLNQFTSEEIPKLLAATKDFEILLKLHDVTLMKRKYEEGIEKLLEDAKRKHQNIFRNTLPWWAWVLIIYLGYDDILRLFYSYWIIPVLLFFSLYGVLLTVGQAHLLTYAIYYVKDFVADKVNALRR